MKAADVNPAADSFGEVEGNPPAAKLLNGGQLVGYVFVTGDVVDSTGYSGKPINIVVGIDLEGRITGAKLVEHHEPIVLVGIPQAKIEHYINGFAGRRVLDPSEATRMPVDIVSGATVTMMVIADSMTQSAVKIARSRGLDAGAVSVASEPAHRTIDQTGSALESWQALLGDGSVRRLQITNRELDDLFQRTGNAAAIARPQQGNPNASFVDVYVALASVPTIGRSLLGDAEYDRLRQDLKPGQQAILVAGDGPYSFRGSGYVRGGIFDRIEVIQSESSIRFRDRNYRRIGALSAEGAPDFPEIGVFVTPDGSNLDPGASWRFQLLVQRATGALDKAFVTTGLDYATPEKFLTAPVSPPAAVAPPVAAAPAPAATQPAATGEAEPPLWQRMWQARKLDIAIMLAAIGVLTTIFFFQDFLVKWPRAFERIRLGYLAFTLVWLGWYEHAQLSVVNILTFFNSLRGDFRWEYFLRDPLVFILWSAIAAALLFWGRGAYCGWLCPFGALQEWTNRVARWLHVPQVRVPFWLHQRLWPFKYIIFLALFGLSFGSLGLAEEMAEVEPFKTAIILHFAREWWFVLFAVGCVAPGLFIERFYCRYVCPLGGALAIPARVRMFDWLKRYKECGSPCQRCANDCPVQAIHPEGTINPNECIQCLNCQVLYHDDQRCPVVIQKRVKREKFLALQSPSMVPGPKRKPRVLVTVNGREQSVERKPAASQAASTEGENQ
ncbi:MAG: regulatory protein NosR [Mesorhizobium sp.]|nr:MAG: regulatory protein NosR [Mesorhizobium sp.]RWL88494.1 MAG: regulatory protein NosR [Mesorhizobium sp.]RWL97198.1 MAG: regulatory protein NosR [Mesorhizobium sp.]TJV69401.1 MAG: regulatory protein NosR [Mesorhizobium sp.]